MGSAADGSVVNADCRSHAVPNLLSEGEKKMTILKERCIALGLIACAAIGVMAQAYPSKSSSDFEDNGVQDVRSLDRRINSLEQRLYSIEVNISRLEQSAISQRAQVLQPAGRDPEITVLRQDMQSLQLRLSEMECGLVKLDERTTASAVRESRGSAQAKTTDPCRLNPATPLRLSTRP